MDSPFHLWPGDTAQSTSPASRPVQGGLTDISPTDPTDNRTFSMSRNKRSQTRKTEWTRGGGGVLDGNESRFQLGVINRFIFLR